MSKLGLGLITCSRELFCKQVLQTIPLDRLDCFVVVNDGTPYAPDTYPDGCVVIQHETTRGVGTAKNSALRYMMQADCDFLFLLEDDIQIKDPEVFYRYIELYQKSGVEHFNFGYHGPVNKHPQTKAPAPKLVIEYDASAMALNSHCVGAFSFYTRNCIESCGYMNERYVNCWEHICHTYKLIKQGLHPPFWWFADLHNSCEYLEELACCEENSVIRSVDTTKRKQNTAISTEIFRVIHGVEPLQIPHTDTREVVLWLRKRLPLTAPITW